MKPYRTVLSVPGHKPSWFDKGVAAGADCLCLDLEDSVRSPARARRVAYERRYRQTVRSVDIWSVLKIAAPIDR